MGIPAKERVARWLAGRRNELVSLCCNLVRAGGENPPGDVSEVASVAEEFLAGEGIGYERLEPRGGRVNLLVSLGRGAKTLVLCGHLDVVPAGDPARWGFPPFCGRVEGGEVLGRGSSDSKGGVAAVLMALAAVKEVEGDLAGRVVGALVCDEEVGGTLGARWLLDGGRLVGNACLIAEPTTYAGARPAIEAGERGLCWLKLRASGRPAHGSWPPMGDNAILKLSSFLPKLGGLERVRVEPPREAKGIVASGKRVLAKMARQGGLPPRLLTRIMDHYTVNVGTVSGGTKANVVPEGCEAEVDVRIPLGGSRVEVETFVRRILPEGIACEVTQAAPPSYSPPGERLVGLLRSNARRVFGASPAAMAVWATTDAWRFRERGIPTVTFGPGYVEKAHARDETVRVADVIGSAKVYALTAVDYLDGDRP